LCPDGRAASVFEAERRQNRENGMLFNSLHFLGFLLVVLVVYPLLRHRWQNAFLLVGSYYFYGCWDWRFTALLGASTVVDFIVGLRMVEATAPTRRKSLLLVSMGANLGILGFFKYYGFFVDSAVGLLAGLGLQPDIPVLNVILPVGISFYTFQTMSYTIDIYRGRLEPTRDFWGFALFVSFFPQLVAGPIERARVLLPQILEPRRRTAQQVREGVALILLGFFKKVAIADMMAPMVNEAFSSPGDLSAGALLSGLYAFSFQIYGDFSGYSDIARGVAKLLGFELMINFQAPYLSRNITEFWRRWHISLSSWLRDYLYISLGGNRGGPWLTYRNLFLTMFLGGLWHGASWTMAGWGVLHGVYLAIHKRMLGDRKPDQAWPRTMGGWAADLARMVVTFHLVGLTWILFRAESFSSAMTYMRGIAAGGGLADMRGEVLVAAALVALLDVVQEWSRSHTWILDRPRSVRYVLAQAMAVCAIAAAVANADTVVPFIYFQF